MPLYVRLIRAEGARIMIAAEHMADFMCKRMVAGRAVDGDDRRESVFRCRTRYTSCCDAAQ